MNSADFSLMNTPNKWENGFFKREIGIEYYKESLTINLLSKRFYLHHGDGFIKKDSGYRVLKKILRKRFRLMSIQVQAV